eukprot:scaffold10240_cov107-Isochrysis_galbana.AAC.6
MPLATAGVLTPPSMLAAGLTSRIASFRIPSAASRPRRPAFSVSSMASGLQSSSGYCLCSTASSRLSSLSFVSQASATVPDDERSRSIAQEGRRISPYSSSARCLKMAMPSAERTCPCATFCLSWAAEIGSAKGRSGSDSCAYAVGTAGAAAGSFKKCGPRSP